MSGRADERRGEPDRKSRARSLGDGELSRVGWVRYFFDEDRWEWSDEVARMHGYEPGTVTPTTELVFSHKHPDDRQELIDLLQRIRRTREAFSSRHRIRDRHGRVHHVVVVGNQLRDDAGEIIGSDGFYIDLTGDLRSAQEQVSNEVEDIAARRSPIDQAKGMLMMVYSIDADAAFDLLRWRSQESNVKLRDLAQQITVDFQRVRHGGDLPPRSVYDELLMTAHLRVGRGS
ncbi:PAS and ANTAR domain-containing protein [Mycobacterium crocinum]|uniref:histidine kinase n=1 Tax=Mycolicibacterium crocinum TaxID=388459 RepID=A0ABY3TP67_9MYCO|nr:PAS and ANTAR domain-containing protein [Mycolicibacterium crocinum]MCV7218190.1 PAS and ANTAR domain-containing protein [Mycolicibacterium crocinum]ULN43171.1 PAS and ANTAR domain-containing protein [Mycolicibacterium crocinum]